MSQQMRYSQGEQGSPFNMTSHPAPGGISPGSPDSFNMDLSRTTDMESFGQYGLLGQDQFGDYSRVPSHSNPGLPHDFGRNVSLPIDQIMRPDAPWDPISGRAGVGVFKSRQQGSYLDYPAFTQHRDTAVPSEYGADSGFYSMSIAESLARKSVVGSVYGDPDRGTETQSFVQPFSELQLQSQHGQTQDSVSVAGEHRQRESWSSQRSPANPEPASLYCDFCKSTVKTKAELNKHKLRHEKPYRCEVPGCTRKQGFGTQNDLARHQQSVHNADGIRYRCREGTCKNKLKPWPRADNFKQHLRRVHDIPIQADMDLSCYEYKFVRNEDLACLGTSEAQADMPTDTDDSPPWLGMDQTHASSGPPSGETGYSNLAPDLELCRFSGPVDDHQPSQSLNAIEPMHQRQSSLDNGQPQSAMHPTLSGFENHQSQGHDIRTGSHVELYQEYPPSGTGVLRPADLMSLTSQRQSIELGSSTHYATAAEKSQEVSHGEDVGSRDQPEQPQRVAKEPGQKSPEEELARHASELAHPEEDDSVDADGEADATDVLDDMRTLFPDLEETVNSNIKVSHTPRPAKESNSAEVAQTKDSPGDSALAELAKLMGKLDKGALEQFISKLGYQKAKEEEEAKAPENPSKPAAPIVEKDGADVPCQESGCFKKFKRPCELKKHMKRHEKPYACTHSDCEKRFGSKNDWKRHENSQHIQLEFWKCAEKLKDGPSASPVCGKICHRRETFKNHLDKDHGITDAKTVEKRCTDCRNGRNFESRFWCGFCKKTIEFGKNGGLAWSERFDHIDAHFTGKEGPKMDIKDWKSIELEPLETFEAILPPEPRPPAEVSKSAAASMSTSGPDQSPNSRKRGLDAGASSSQPKRVKSSGRRTVDPRKEYVMWFCCSCQNYWSHDVTTHCLETNCGHEYCSRCKIEVQIKGLDD